MSGLTATLSGQWQSPTLRYRLYRQLRFGRSNDSTLHDHQTLIASHLAREAMHRHRSRPLGRSARYGAVIWSICRCPIFQGQHGRSLNDLRLADRFDVSQRLRATVSVLILLEAESLSSETLDPTSLRQQMRLRLSLTKLIKTSNWIAQ